MGGRLADPPQAIRETLRGDSKGRTPVQLALDWVWDQPEVTVVLSGMSTMEQVKENLRFAEAAAVGRMTEADESLLDQVRQQYRDRIRIPCTQCGYCMPCPTGVYIPHNFEFYNYAHIYDDLVSARFRYNFALKEGQRASACIACGMCEAVCPQQIPISEWMPKVAAELG